MAHEKSETVQNPIDNMFYNLDTVDDRHRRINPYDYFPEAELESPNVGVERGLGVLGGPYKTGEEGAEAARKRSMNFRERRIMPVIPDEYEAPASRESREQLLRMEIDNIIKDKLKAGRFSPKGNLLQALFALGELMQSGQKSFTEGYKPGMRLR